MVKVIYSHAEKKLTVAEIFNCDNTCLLEDGRIAFCAYMEANLFNKLDEEDSILCFTLDDDGEPNIEYIRTDAPAIPCDVEITVD